MLAVVIIAITVVMVWYVKAVIQWRHSPHLPFLHTNPPFTLTIEDGLSNNESVLIGLCDISYYRELTNNCKNSQSEIVVVGTIR